MALNREQVIQTAEKYVAKNRIEAAIKEYRKLLAENPNDANTLNRLGDLYSRINRNDEAIRLFTDIAEKYTHDGFYLRAIAIFKKIIRIDPTRLEAYERLAELYASERLVNEARGQYQVLVDYYLKHNNSASAINVLSRMSALDPNDPEPYQKLAEIYQQQKLFDKALASYKTIADLMLQHKRVDDATRVLLRALDVAPQDLGFITDAVLGLKDAGHTGAAARLLTAAIEKNPLAEKIAKIAGLGPRGAPHAAEAPKSFVAPPTPARPSPPPPAPPPPVTAKLEPFSLGADLEIDLEEEIEVAPPPAPAPAEPSFEGLGDLAGGEIDLGFPGEDEEAPSTLVQPPPDFVPSASKRARLTAAPTGEPKAIEEDTLLEIDLEGLAAPEIELAPPPAAVPSPPRLDVDAELPEQIEWSFSEEPSLDIDLTALEPPELGLPELPAPVLAPPPVAGPPSGPPVLSLDTELLEKAAAEVHPPPQARREDDLLAEAEVLAKYGMSEKAHDRLRAVLQINPRHLGAHAMQIGLFLDEGKHDKVLARANQVARLAFEVRQPDVWKQLRQRLLKTGYRLEGDSVVAAPVPVGGAKDRVSKLLESLVEAPPTPARGAKKPSAKVPAPPELTAESILLPEPARPASKKAAPPVKPKKGPSKVEAALSALASEARAKPTKPVRKPDALAAPSVEVEAPPVEAPPPVELAAPPAAPPEEIELAAPLTAGPEEVELAAAAPEEMPSFLQAHAPAIEPPLGALDETELPGVAIPMRAPGPPPGVGDRLDESGMNWLDEVVKPAPGAPPAPEEDLFGDEEGFFDLAAELEQELSKEELVPSRDLVTPPQEQTLAEIVEGFKKGVAENLSPEDYDTHYNLGIAYREMGLLDEAIGEFQLAAKDPRYLVDCCSMLGICFLDKGIPELAIKWYKRGLESPGIAEEPMLGLMYDLGSAYQALGDRSSAYTTFVEIYGINTNYRDIVAKLEDVQH